MVLHASRHDECPLWFVGLVTNHGLVDWLVGLLMGSTLNRRCGWASRRVHDDAHADLRLVSELFGDIFETDVPQGQAPHPGQHKKREAKVDQVIFLAPEKFPIVDPGVEKDAEYVQQCSKFMLDPDRRPLKTTHPR